MQTGYGHLTYCSNIHPGVSWEHHFNELRTNVPLVRQAVAGNAPMALGLRCSNEASLVLTEELDVFRQWLSENHLYVISINGFPYADFHQEVVKDRVHRPDWTTAERLDYTKRLCNILARLLPDGMEEGGVSTPPLSYRHWWGSSLPDTADQATRNLLKMIGFLIDLRQETGKLVHIDIEPEPDGILDNGGDFFEWYSQKLLPMGVRYLQEERGFSADEAREAIYAHLRLCYDVCHFAVSYEDPATVFAQLAASGIRVGRIQVSSALRVDLGEKREEKLNALRAFLEPIYLHQVVARTQSGELVRYPDLDLALAADSADHVEWRVHFHVPLFMDAYGLLRSTRPDINQVLELHQANPVTNCLEIETYTWGVLPRELQMPIADSIIREMKWVKQQLEKN